MEFQGRFKPVLKRLRRRGPTFVVELRACFGPDAEDASVGGQIGQDGTDKQVQGIAHGRKLGESLVAGGGVILIEGDGGG